jgi:hypothetical protein
MPLLKNITVTIDFDEVIKRQGVADPAKLHPRLISEVREILTNIEQLIEPAVVYEIFNIKKILPDKIITESGEIFPGAFYPQFFPDAKKLVAVICTIGPKLETEVAVYIDRHRSSKASVLDGIGSLAANHVAVKALEHIKGIAATGGLSISGAVRPGIGKAPIAEQKHIFDLVQASEIGISISPAGILVPHKSISMVLGMGHHSSDEHNGEKCDTCNLKDTCAQRLITKK